MLLFLVTYFRAATPTLDNMSTFFVWGETVMSSASFVSMLSNHVHLVYSCCFLVYCLCALSLLQLPWSYQQGFLQQMEADAQLHRHQSGMCQHCANDAAVWFCIASEGMQCLHRKTPRIGEDTETCVAAGLRV